MYCQHIASPFRPQQGRCHANGISLTYGGRPPAPDPPSHGSTVHMRPPKYMLSSLPPTAKRVSPPHQLFPPVSHHVLPGFSALGASGWSKVPKLPQGAGLAPLRSFLVPAALCCFSRGRTPSSGCPAPFCCEVFETETSWLFCYRVRPGVVHGRNERHGVISDEKD